MTQCILIVNTANGYCCQPIKCRSISSAVRLGKESCGFAFRVLVDGKVVRTGFCR